MTIHTLVPDARRDFEDEHPQPDEQTQPGSDEATDVVAALCHAQLATQGRINDLHDAITRGYMLEVALAATQLAMACFSLAGAVWAVRAETPERQASLRASLDEIGRLRDRIGALFEQCARARTLGMDSPTLQVFLARCASSIARALTRATLPLEPSGS
jgi:hypothetical protein